MLPQNLHHNAYGQLLPPLSQQQQPQYDVHGNVLLPQYSNENVQTPQYDTNGQLMLVPPRQQQQQQYDANGQLTPQVLLPPPGHHREGLQLSNGVWMEVRVALCLLLCMLRVCVYVCVFS